MICVKPFRRKIPGSNGEYVPLPCGQCVCCRVNKAREWAFRMVAESGYWPESAFLTLTYADDSVINVCKEDLQKAFKRARKSGLKFKYFASSEYGGDNGRPHYHVCIFYQGDLGFTPDVSYGRNNGHLSWWPHGISNLGTFSVESARYTADYMLKALGDPAPAFVAEPFRLVSLGLSKQYLLDNRTAFENDAIPFRGSYLAVPRYYRKFMTRWVDEDGVLLSTRKFMARIGGKTLSRQYWANVCEQRERNFTTRQIMHKKEF